MDAAVVDYVAAARTRKVLRVLDVLYDLARRGGIELSGEILEGTGEGVRSLLAIVAEVHPLSDATWHLVVEEVRRREGIDS